VCIIFQINEKEKKYDIRLQKPIEGWQVITEKRFGEHVTSSNGYGRVVIHYEAFAPAQVLLVECVELLFILAGTKRIFCNCLT
jgi:hypothetical protein